MSELIAEKQKNAKTIIEPVAGPQYWPYLLERGGIRAGCRLNWPEKVFHGCAAGRGFVYIKANGDIWPCPFVEVSGGNIRERVFMTFIQLPLYFRIYAIVKKSSGTLR